jgi:N-acetylglucosamine-6-phosphate deacetylase
VSTTVLAAAGVCTRDATTPGWVAMTDGVIDATGVGRAPGAATELGGVVLAPAFVDLQLNGVQDVDLASADHDGWHRAGRELARHGIGAYLATFVSAPPDAYDASLATLAATRAACEPGAARAVGAHLEGPFLGGAPGAHRPELLRPADIEWLAARWRAHGDLVRMVTLAPEADPGLLATRWLTERGVLVALGHSQATELEARDAAAAGARVVTHLFNAMRPFHHREVGLAGAALDDERLTPTLIADLVHVGPTAIRLAFAATPTVALVSDAVATGGSIREVDGAARLADGRLAGATVLLDRAVANVVRLGIPLERAVAAASTVPAALLGLADRGRIEAGAAADVVALDPTSGMLRGAWIAGERTA